jgi:hypothetical protein
MNKEEAAVKKAINVVGRVVHTLDMAGCSEQTRTCMTAGAGELHFIADELETNRYDGSEVTVDYDVPEQILAGLGRIVQEVSEGRMNSKRTYPELPGKIRELAEQLNCLVRTA